MIGATVNLSSVMHAFDRLKRTDGRKVFRTARKPMREDLREHSRSQSAPTRRWPPLAATTLVRRGRARTGRSRRLLGRIPGAHKLTSGVDFVRATWLRPWFRVHRRGGVVGHGSKIPARDFAWISSKLKKQVTKLWRDALGRAWAGR